MQLYILAAVMLSVSVTGIRAFTKSTSSRYVMNRMLSMRGSSNELDEIPTLHLTERVKDL